MNTLVGKIFLGTSVLGLATGIIGVLLTLRKQALLGDALSHTVLPGIALSYFYFHHMQDYVLWLGAVVSSLVVLFLLAMIKRYSIIDSDTALALILASFFGLGYVLIAYIHQQPAYQDNTIAILEKFILGQPALLLDDDLFYIVVIASITLLVVLVLWKELKIFTFDEKFTRTLGFNINLIAIIFNLLLISIICLSLKLVGIILTSAFLIIPGVIARQLSDRLFMNVIIAALANFFASLVGVYLSSIFDNLPTGPMITVISTLLVVSAFLFAPKRGMLFRFWQQCRYQYQIKKFRQLIHFYYDTPNTISTLTVIDDFLIAEKYLIWQNQQLQITTKGKQLVENLIKGKK